MPKLIIDPDEIRKYYPGFIGGKEIAEKATDAEVVALAEWTDMAVCLRNRLREVERFTNNLQEAIRSR